MEILIYTLIAFALIAITSTIICVTGGVDLSDLLPVYKPRKKIVRAAFWGDYTDAHGGTDDETFALPTISDDEGNPVAGSEVYSKGKAVKSLRR
jgi:hypothetical protein